MTEGIPPGAWEAPDGRTVVNPEEIPAGDGLDPYAETLRPGELADQMADTDPAPTLRSPTEADRPPAPAEEPAPTEPSGDGPDVDPEVGATEVDESIPETQRSPGNELTDVEGAEGAEGAEAAEGGEALLEGGEVVAEGAEVAETGLGLAEGLTAFGEGVLAVEAAGGAEAELATGPVGWVVGAGALAVAGAAIGAGYLLSDDDDPSTQPGAGDLAPAAQPAVDPSGYDPSGYDESAMG